MALIKCPECGKDISDMAGTCPNCGYPVKTHSSSMSTRKKYIYDCNECYAPTGFDSFVGTTCKCSDCGGIAEYVETEVISNETGKVIDRYRENGFERPVQQQSQKTIPHCPKCGSTSITAGARGINWFWGTIGSGKTVNRCANCGYTWKPNGR